MLKVEHAVPERNANGGKAEQASQCRKSKAYRQGKRERSMQAKPPELDPESGSLASLAAVWLPRAPAAFSTKRMGSVLSQSPAKNVTMVRHVRARSSKSGTTTVVRPKIVGEKPGLV
jgi:hypothetical protein